MAHVRSAAPGVVSHNYGALRHGTVLLPPYITSRVIAVLGVLSERGFRHPSCILPAQHTGALCNAILGAVRGQRAEKPQWLVEHKYQERFRRILPARLIGTRSLNACYNIPMTMIEGDKLPTLSSQRVVLRWLEDSDLPRLFDIFSDARVMRYWSSEVWKDEADGIRLIEGIRQCFAEGSLYQWGVARRTDDSIIGTCTLAHVDAQNRRAEVGFSLRHDHWGQGYMSEALHTLLHFAFEELGLQRIEADVDPRNAPSLRLLERLGFQREGYLRERWIVGQEINDSILLGLLQREYRQA